MKKTLRLGESFIAEKENGFLKISHVSKDWNIRVAGSEEGLSGFFEQAKEDESRAYFANISASVKVFSLLALNNPLYIQAWILFHNKYFEDLAVPVTKEEDDTILADMEAIYNEEQKIMNELKQEKDEL